MESRRQLRAVSGRVRVWFGARIDGPRNPIWTSGSRSFRSQARTRSDSYSTPTPTSRRTGRTRTPKLAGMAGPARLWWESVSAVVHDALHPVRTFNRGWQAVGVSGLPWVVLGVWGWFGDWRSPLILALLLAVGLLIWASARNEHTRRAICVDFEEHPIPQLDHITGLWKVVISVTNPNSGRSFVPHCLGEMEGVSPRTGPFTFRWDNSNPDGPRLLGKTIPESVFIGNVALRASGLDRG